MCVVSSVLIRIVNVLGEYRLKINGTLKFSISRNFISFDFDPLILLFNSEADGGFSFFLPLLTGENFFPCSICQHRSLALPVKCDCQALHCCNFSFVMRPRRSEWILILFQFSLSLAALNRFKC